MWITDKNANSGDGLYRFRRRFNAKKGSRLNVRVSADTRYKLFINGNEVLCGPCKGNRFVTYYETADLSNYLTDGENNIEALVLHLDYRMAAIHRTEKMAFMLDGEVVHPDGGSENVSTDENWLVARDNSFICTAPPYWCLTDFTEKIEFSAANLDFAPAEKVCDAVFDRDYAYGEISKWVLSPREIPPLTNTERKFVRVMKSSLPADEIILGGEISFPPNSTSFVEIDAGVHFTGTPHIKISGGKGAEVKLTYAESYIFKDGWKITKKNRDNTDGIIYGMTDQLVCDGEAHIYEPFWFRTFRFVRVEVTTADSPLSLSDLKFYENKYPLAVSAKFESSDPDAAALWETSIRTVNNCMHETFEDCPYYEQTQYAMDTRLEALFTFCLGSDRRLAKKCLTEFMQSQYPDGMTQARYPSLNEQVIPGFALHVIYLAADYLKYTPTDRRFIRGLLPKIDAILNWFDNRVNESGVVGDTEYWRFLDWVKEWKDGSPGKGAMSCYSFMYSLALKCAADLYNEFGFCDMAAEYEKRRERINKAAYEFFYNGEKSLFADTENGGYSWHSQIWAVLADAVTGAEATALLERMLSDKTLSRCSYSMMFFVFRALEKAGLYEKAYDLLEGWRNMLSRGLTTWAEDDIQERSDCHGWGSLPIYEFTSVILGVKPLGYDGKAVEIRPNLAGLDFAKGVVPTSAGDIKVDWKKDGKNFALTVEGDGEKHIIMPNGESHIVTEPKKTLFCAI